MMECQEDRASPRDRLHIKVSRSCNNNCTFCLDDRDLRSDVTEQEVRRLLDEHRHLGQMLFTCGEPTLHPLLPMFVAMAKKMGYSSIGIVTNGRRLSYAAYCARLLSLGLNEVTISIHGASARVHDALTRARGSFGQTLAGLENVLGMKVRFDVRVVTSTVVTRRNMEGLGDVVAMLGGMGVDTMVLNVVEPSGEALAHMEVLVPPYEILAGHVARAVEGTPYRERIVVEGIPLCLCRSFLDLTGIRERIHLMEGGKLCTLPPDRNHVKTARCDGCDLTALCPGVFAEYVRIRGW